MNIPELTHQNHFQFGYDNKPFVFRKSAEEKWFVKFGRCRYQPGGFKEECIRTARQIAEDAKSKVTVLFSGGVDSEVTLRSFLLAKIPVRAAILRFKNDLNIHDISYAISICEQLNVTYNFFDLDILDFWKNQLLTYADPTQSVSPQLLSTMWLVDQIDEYPILGSGECHLVKRIPLETPFEDPAHKVAVWDLHEKEKIAAWFRHFIVRNRQGSPAFYQYTPEIIYAYLTDPYVQAMTSNQIYGKRSSVSSKLKIYQQYFSLTDRDKFSGFEKLQAEDAHYRQILLERFKHSNQYCLTPVPELVESMAYRP